MIVYHIGCAVKDIQEAKNQFEKLGYKFEELRKDTDRNILIMFGNNETTRVELVQTAKEEEDSPIVGI